jgi:hypothetical protein
MRTGRPKSPIMLSKEEHEQLRAMANFRSLCHDLINRARIVLMAIERFPNLQVANQVYLSPQSVYCRTNQATPAIGINEVTPTLKIKK